MKQQIEDGVCIYGDYPGQEGCFRGSDVVDDFATILKALDLFWD